MNKVQIGELEIPSDYFKLNEESKKELCLEMIDVVLMILDKRLNKEINRFDMLDLMLISSIQTNLEDEKYEICQFLTDIRNILNEQIR